MANVPSAVFSLTIDGHKAVLISFSGEEGLNRTFRFELTIEPPSTLQGEQKPLKDLYGTKATLSIHKYADSLYPEDVHIDGYIDEAGKQGGYYVITLRPEIQRKSTNKRSEIYFSEQQDLSADELIRRELADELDIRNSSFKNWNRNNDIVDFNPALPPRRMFCQYNESNLNFLGRTCEHWGIYFYFDHFEETLVFSNNKEYDQRIDSRLNVLAQAEPENLLDLYDWQEEYHGHNQKVSVTGFNPRNASKEIEASYPHDANEEAVELRYHFDDIETEDGAQYLAQIIFERELALQQTARCYSRSPHLHAGFIITTDNPDFSTALITSLRHSAIKLEPIGNDQFSGDYQAELTLVPGDKQYRPPLHYQLPEVKTHRGRVVSDSDNDLLAMRNDFGEYKISLSGFDHESGVFPWVRKTQTTAANNTIDFPLLPDTEVVLSFIAGNPNCPVIEHALENSINPIPVTNENSHQAKVATNGMLVTSALQGRFEKTQTSHYSTTTDEIFPQQVNAASLLNLGTTSNTEFLRQQEKSGDISYRKMQGNSLDLFDGDRIEIQRGKKATIHQHQSYDIAGQYQESLPSSLSDSVVSDAEGSRKRGDFDLFNRPQIGVAATLSTSAIEKHGYSQADLVPDAIANASELDIRKQITSSYHYQTGSCINVRDNVSTLDIVNTEEDTQNITLAFKKGKLVEYNDGDITKKWSDDGELLFKSDESEDGVSETTEWFENTGEKKSWQKETENDTSITSEETTYHITNGNPVAYTKSTSDGAGTSEFSMQMAPAANASLSFSPSTEFSLSSDSSASLAISLSAQIAIEVAMAASIDIKTGLAAELELDLRTGVAVGLDEKGKIEVSGIGFRAYAEARAEAGTKATELKQTLTELKNTSTSVSSEQIALLAKALEISTGVKIEGI